MSRYGIPMHSQAPAHTWEDVAYKTIPREDWMTRVYWQACSIMAEREKELRALRLKRREIGEPEPVPAPKVNINQAYLDAVKQVRDEDEDAPLLHAAGRFPN